jgi:hypothetical protein
VGKQSQRKRETTREQRLDASGRFDPPRPAGGRLPAQEIRIRHLYQQWDGRDGVGLEWLDADGVLFERDFDVYQDAQSYGYALMRGERR